MQDLIRYLLDLIVTHREDVQIESDQDGRRTVFRVRVHPDDLGAVIGRSGRTINAIRTLVSAAATQQDDGAGSCWVKLVDSDEQDEEADGDEDDAGAPRAAARSAAEDDEGDETAEDFEDDDDVVYEDDDEGDDHDRPVSEHADDGHQDSQAEVVSRQGR